MADEQVVAIRIEQLIDEAPGLREENEWGNAKHPEECAGWIAATQHVVHLACPSEGNAYRVMIDKLAARPPSSLHIHNTVGAMYHILHRLSDDIRDGLLASIVDHARAEVFGDFLDAAKEYEKRGRKNEAGVIAGVVFEDTLRRLCDKQAVPEKGQPLDQLISELTKRGALTPTKSKRARVAAHLRTQATHAQWEEFDSGDVRATIEFADELVGMLDS